MKELIQHFMGIVFFSFWMYYLWFSKGNASYEEYKKSEEEQHVYMGWYYGSKFVFWGNRIIVLVFFIGFAMAFIYRLFDAVAVVLTKP